VKRVLCALIGLSLLSATALAQQGFEGRPITDNLFVPTGYTLHKGEFAIGIGPVAFGISENVQVETNVLLWAFQAYNAGLKLALKKDDDGAFALGAGVVSPKLDLIDDDGDDNEVSFLGIGPYASYSTRMSPSTIVHVGGRYTYFSAEDDDTDVDDVDATSSASGTAIFGGIEYSMSHRTKFVADAGYDFDFDGGRVGGGVIFGWTTFRLKLGVSYYSAGDGFVFPNIGLWWRFKG
jgi:hypothetical protein